jgi:hypothetical protein
MWKGWAKREQREQAALDFWYACKREPVSSHIWVKRHQMFVKAEITYNRADHGAKR